MGAYIANTNNAKQENTMANIPNSSRYRSSGSRASANVGAAGRTWSAHNNSNPRGIAFDQPASMSWLWGLAALGLLIAFPYHVLGVIGLALFVSWFFGKK